MKVNKKMIWLVIFCFVLVVGGLSYYVYQKNSLNKYDYKEKIGKNPCDALSPECGYCPGEKIDGYCYYNK